MQLRLGKTVITARNMYKDYSMIGIIPSIDLLLGSESTTYKWCVIFEFLLWSLEIEYNKIE